MNIIESKKLIIGYSYEKPKNYADGWEFLELGSSSRYVSVNNKWLKTNETSIAEAIIEAKKGYEKIPQKQLMFKNSSKIIGSGNAFHVSECQNKLYWISVNITETTDIEVAPTLGVVWDNNWGVAKDLIVFPDGSLIVFIDFTTITTFALECRILKFTNINDTAPVTVYTSGHDSQWAGEFGIKHYINGLGALILAGEYGNTTNSKNLLLCKDFGETWSVIKTTGVSTNEFNNHFHDVDIDPYNSVLWVGQGDGPGDARVTWSQTMGSTWIDLIPDTNLGAGVQPTLIMSFPENTIFGNDSGAAGFSRVKSPKSLKDWDVLLDGNGMPEMFHVTRNRTIGGEPCYPHYANKWGSQGICVESAHGSQFPIRIFMTGDGGRSFHTVSLPNWGGNTAVQQISLVLGIDSDYVYTKASNSGAILYAIKPIFS